MNDSVKMRTTHARSMRTPKKCEQCQVNLDMYLVSGTHVCYAFLIYIQVTLSFSPSPFPCVCVKPCHHIPVELLTYS